MKKIQFTTTARNTKPGDRFTDWGGDRYIAGECRNGAELSAVKLKADGSEENALIPLNTLVTVTSRCQEDLWSVFEESIGKVAATREDIASLLTLAAHCPSIANDIAGVLRMGGVSPLEPHVILGDLMRVAKNAVTPRGDVSARELQEALNSIVSCAKLFTDIDPSDPEFDPKELVTAMDETCRTFIIASSIIEEVVSENAEDSE